MAVWALLSISQTVKAADVTVYFQSPDGWSTPVKAYVYDDAKQYYKAWGSAEECTSYSTPNNGIKLWSYTFPDKFTNVIFKDGTHQHPAKDINMKVVNNYVYTTNGTTGTPLSEFDKVTKVIKLFNGSSEVTGYNGKYTLDLSGETSTDATVTLSIDGTAYGLATAQTISAVGTTNVDFVANKTDALTLTKGLIYSLSVTKDGKMTVEAKEKVNPYKVAGAGFYLVGDFMSPYNHSDVNPGGDIPGKINYERLYFKFEQQADGSYKIDIPACLTAKMQILGISVDGVPRVYGPSGIVELYGAKDHGTASPVTDGSVGGNSKTNNLVVVDEFKDSDNFWNLVTRNDGVTDDDGIYEVSFTFDSDSKTPKIWTIKHNSLKRVVYLLSNAQGATAQPLYDSRIDIPSGYSDVSSASAVHLEGITNKYFVLGTVVRNMSTPEIKKQAIKADDGIHEISQEKGGKQCGTHTKFFFLGADPVYESDNTTIKTQDSYQLTANKPAVAISKLEGNKIVQVNPTKGRDDVAGKDNSYGM